MRQDATGARATGPVHGPEDVLHVVGHCGRRASPGLPPCQGKPRPQAWLVGPDSLPCASLSRASNTHYLSVTMKLLQFLEQSGAVCGCFSIPWGVPSPIVTVTCPSDSSLLRQRGCHPTPPCLAASIPPPTSLDSPSKHPALQLVLRCHDRGLLSPLPCIQCLTSALQTP